MYSDKKVYAVIVAAGSGKRMAAMLPKQFLKIGGKTILETTVDKFNDSNQVDRIIIVTAEEYFNLCCQFFREDIDSGRISIVEGGAERQDSVERALAYINQSMNPDTEDIILIHDGVRPYATAELIEKVICGVHEEGTAVAAVPTKDTIRHTEKGTLDRGKLYNVQTPQGFKYGLISESFDKAKESGFRGTDDASLVEKAGHKVSLVRGEESNIKITTPEDLNVESRIGTGYDVHRLIENRDLILGGVKIPYEKGLLGYSDADVLIHALIDALLGAAALGDIGRLFPDNDEKYKDVCSLKLLEEVGRTLTEEGYYTGNVDITVICERPKLACYIPVMVQNIAKVLGIDKDKVNIKATTTEKLGFTGREEGIAAQAVCILNR